jgi:hypothetical protein
MKKGMVVDEVVKWIVAIAILIAAGFAVRGIVAKFA